jgi:hypothetical protein
MEKFKYKTEKSVANIGVQTLGNNPHSVYISLYFVSFFVVGSKRKYNTQNYNFACGSVWVRNLVSAIKGGT